MKIVSTLMAATMLVGLAAPARADYDYDDYLDDVRDRQEDYRKAVRRQQKNAYRAYRNGYGVRVAPRYYSYYSQPYYGRYYRSNGGSLIGGILDAIF